MRKIIEGYVQLAAGVVLTLTLMTIVARLMANVQLRQMLSRLFGPRPVDSPPAALWDVLADARRITEEGPDATE